MNLGEHPSTDAIEQYLSSARTALRGPLEDAGIDDIEQHLLVCAGCLDAAENEVALGSLIRNILLGNEAEESL